MSKRWCCRRLACCGRLALRHARTRAAQGLVILSRVLASAHSDGSGHLCYSIRLSHFLLRARTGALNPETSLWHASPRSQPWQRWRSSRWRWSLTRASCCKVGAAAQSRCVSIAFHSSMCIALGRHLSPQNTIVFNWSTASFRYRQGGAALGGLRTDGPNL